MTATEKNGRASRDHNDQRLLDAMIDLALAAGAKALEIYGEEIEVAEKSDASPVTKADKLGEEIILRGLAQLAPAIPVLAEEEAAAGNIPDLGDAFFLVDPLDGTKEFINRTGEFTVNIALIRHGVPVIGVVYAPASSKLYAACCGRAHVCLVDENGALGAGKTITTRTPPSDGLTAVASRSHRTPETDALLETMNIGDFAAAGSSLKFCLIAEGCADVYPRLGRTMEWDTGAGQAVLEAAGGSVLTHPEGAPLRYRKQERGYDNPHFVAWGSKTGAA